MFVVIFKFFLIKSCPEVVYISNAHSNKKQNHTEFSNIKHSPTQSYDVLYIDDMYIVYTIFIITLTVSQSILHTCMHLLGTHNIRNKKKKNIVHIFTTL